ncbi:MAG: hypothetical protein HBSAPP04_22850 [Ignavibacteriaceae bacterium]|nr:MAG: hypothetical protein HBSAPP04_22850 [Ignavibacteriaceae bacterium]
MKDTEVLILLQDHMTKTGRTQAAIARQIGISPAAINQYLKGEYGAGIANIERKIKSYLTRETDKGDISLFKHEFIPTYFSGRVIETARFCHLESEVGVVIGDPGTGKTTAVKHYAATNLDAILIEADPGYNAKAVLEDILLKLNGETGKNLHRMMADVISRLKDSGRLIIIDEAENLPHKALEVIRRIHDKAEIGILFTGMPRLISNLRGKRGEFAQLYSRVGKLTNLNHLRAEMPDALEADTELIVSTYLPGTNGYWKNLHLASKGNPRVLVKLIRRSTRLAEVNHTKINAEVDRKSTRLNSSHRT